MNRQEAHSSLPWRAVLSHEQQPQPMYRGLICVLERSPDQWTSVVAASGEAGADRETIDANARFIVTAANHHHALVDLLSECAEFLDNYRDVDDGDDGRPVPNRAAGLYSRVTELLAQIDREEEK